MRGSVLLPLFIMAAIASAERKKLTNDDFPEAVVNDKVQAPSFDEDDYAASSSCIATDDEDDNSKMASQRCLLFPIGANVEAVWVGDGNWYQAKVLQIWEPESPEFTVKYMVHYIGYSKAEDQIVSRHHVRALDGEEGDNDISDKNEDNDDYDDDNDDDDDDLVAVVEVVVVVIVVLCKCPLSCLYVTIMPVSDEDNYDDAMMNYGVI